MDRIVFKYDEGIPEKKIVYGAKNNSQSSALLGLGCCGVGVAIKKADLSLARIAGFPESFSI
jgi:hypothetical protein